MRVNMEEVVTVFETYHDVRIATLAHCRHPDLM